MIARTAPVLLLLVAAAAHAQEALPAGWTRVSRVVGGTPTAAACSSDTAFIREWTGTVTAFDGSAGRRLPLLTASAYGRSIAVDRANRPMIATSSGIATYDGSAWQIAPIVWPDAAREVTGLLSLDTTHRYFVTDGAIGAGDADHFGLFAIGAWRHFDALAGTSDHDLWAVGQGGTVMHWDGAAWRRERANTDAWLHGIAVLGSDVWAWSDHAILHRQASGWGTSAMSSPVGVIVSLAPTPRGVFVVGEAGVARFEAGTWSPELTSAALGSYASYAAACATDRSLVVVLSAGDVLARTL